MGDEHHTCEVCGEPATCTVREAVEQEPEDGMRRYEPGPTHHYCKAHRKLPVVQQYEAGG